MNDFFTEEEMDAYEQNFEAVTAFMDNRQKKLER